MVKILDRYIFFKVFKYFILSFVVLIAIFLLADFVSKVDLISKGYTKEVFFLVFSRLPLYAVRMLPIATLVGVMVAVSELSSTNELVAIKSLGVSIYRVSVSIFIFSCFVAFSSFLIIEFLLPSGASLERELLRNMGKRASTYVVTSEIWGKVDNRFFSVQQLDITKGEGKNFSLIKLDRNFVPVFRVDALGIRYEGNGLWKLISVYERNLVSEASVFKKRETLNLGVSVEDLRTYFVDPATMELFSLVKLIHNLRMLGYNTVIYEVEVYAKIAMALIPIVVAVLGIPLGAYNPRNQKGYTIILAVSFIVVMWVTISFFANLGKSGILPPFYAAFAPEFIFLAVGLILYSRTHT